MFRKILVTLAALVGIVVVVFAIFVASRQSLRFDAPYPNVAASADSAVIARGRYVVRDLAVCASCHGDTARAAEGLAGADIPLSGGFFFDIPPGKIHVPNITSDSATGLGKVTDQAIARAIRHGVGHDGRALLPFMEFQGLSDEDLAAAVSYLRTQAPVHHPVPAHEYRLLGRILKATVLANPVGPQETPPAVSPRGATLENGRYLVEAVTLCGACHTQRNQATGAFEGPPFGGSTGFIEGPDPTHSWSPPNITADPETGKLGKLTEDEFVARFRTGRVLPGSPMPWQGYQRMAEDDLRAIYRYLKSVPPARRDVGPPLVEVKR